MDALSRRHAGNKRVYKQKHPRGRRFFACYSFCMLEEQRNERWKPTYAKPDDRGTPPLDKGQERSEERITNGEKIGGIYTIYDSHTGTVYGRGFTASEAADVALTRDGGNYELRHEDSGYWQLYVPFSDGRRTTMKARYIATDPKDSTGRSLGFRDMPRSSLADREEAWRDIAHQVLARKDWSVTQMVMHDDDYDDMLADTIDDFCDKITKKESIPGHPYNQQYDMWVVARREQVERKPGGRGPQVAHVRHQYHYETMGPARLYLASQETMVALINEAVRNYQYAFKEYEKNMEGYRAVEQERVTYAEMTEALKGPGEKFMEFMVSDTGKEIERLLGLLMMGEQEDGDYPLEEKERGIFNTLREQLIRALPNDMHIIKYEPDFYEGKPPRVSVEWANRVYEIALITRNNDWDWKPGIQLLLPKLPERPVPPALLPLKLNHEHPDVEVKEEIEE